METIASKARGHAPRPLSAAPASAGTWPSGRSNGPSYLYLLLVGANTAAVAWLAGPAANWLLLAPLVGLQAVLLIGLQEAKHQCVHRQMLVGTPLNEVLGVVLAGLSGVNFVGYRHFHLAHHRRTCQDDDPEGLLYRQSWRTRWICAFGAVEQVWVAVNINGLSRRYVPREAVRRWQLNNVVLLLFAAALAWGLYRAPWPVLCCYVLPYCLFAWMDFFPTQAEHYGVPIASTRARQAPADITIDLQLPRWLSWLTLHRTLHRAHHAAPATRWFLAEAASRRLGPGGTTTLPAFVRAWMRHGPRLWR